MDRLHKKDWTAVQLSHRQQASCNTTSYWSKLPVSRDYESFKRDPKYTISDSKKWLLLHVNVNDFKRVYNFLSW